MSKSELAAFITYNPSTVTIETPLSELLQMLEDFGFHHWPVVDGDRRLVGVVSDADILRRLEQIDESEHDSLAQLLNCGAGEIMSRRLVTITPQESVCIALRRLTAHRIHSLPVLEGQRLIGMITSTDFLRDFSFGELPISHSCVTEFMSIAADPIGITESLDDALRAMQTAGSQSVAVVQDGCPLGVLSKRQLNAIKCRQAASAKHACVGHDDDSELTQVAQLMSQAPTLRPGDRMQDAAAVMVDQRLHALAVVNQAHRLLGIVSEEDVLRAMLER